MATLTIRNLDEVLKTRLRVLAAQHGCSMEEEVRQILRDVLTAAEPVPPQHLADLAVSLFGPAHGVELVVPERTVGRDLPTFEA